MTCRARLVRRSSRPYDAEAEAAVSCLSFVLDAWRREKQAGSAFKNRWRVDPTRVFQTAFRDQTRRLSIALGAEKTPPGKWLALARRTSGLAPNKPRRNDGVSEATTRDARKVRAGHHHDDPSTDVDRHLPDCLRAVTRASRSITPRVADPSPSSRGRRAKHRKAATRDRPTENHADR